MAPPEAKSHAHTAECARCRRNIWITAASLVLSVLAITAAIGPAVATGVSRTVNHITPRTCSPRHPGEGTWTTVTYETDSGRLLWLRVDRPIVPRPGSIMVEARWGPVPGQSQLNVTTSPQLTALYGDYVGGCDRTLWSVNAAKQNLVKAEDWRPPVYYGFLFTVGAVLLGTALLSWRWWMKRRQGPSKQ